jgi:hypothetical protein
MWQGVPASSGERFHPRAHATWSSTQTLIDAVLGCRGEKDIDEVYYSEVSRNVDSSVLLIRNVERGNFLKVDMENVIFIKDLYEIDRHFDLDKSLQEFRQIWNVINDILKLSNIRRIGMFAEHRFPYPSSTPSKILIEKFTKISSPLHPAKFHLRYEDRTFASTIPTPNIKKDDFLNIIYDIYDGEMDASHPEQDQINVNLDVQRYYSPLLNGNVFDEVNKLKKEFQSQKTKFASDLTAKGLL